MPVQSVDTHHSRIVPGPDGQDTLLRLSDRAWQLLDECFSLDEVYELLKSDFDRELLSGSVEDILMVLTTFESRDRYGFANDNCPYSPTMTEENWPKAYLFRDDVPGIALPRIKLRQGEVAKVTRFGWL